MLDETKLRRVLRTQLKTVTELPVEALRHWENRPFTIPSVDEPSLWIRETLLISSERQVSVGQVQVQGEVIYSVFFPANRGTESPAALAKAIAVAFKPGQSLVGLGLEIPLERTERTSGTDDLWYFINVTVQWRTHITI